MKRNKTQRINTKTEKPKQGVIDQKDYITLLEKLMNFISHNIRQPVAHIMGLSYILKSGTDNPIQLNKNLMYIKQSALLLDKRSRELSILIYKKILSLKKADEARIIKKPIIR